MENKRLFGKICLVQKLMYRQNNHMFADLGVSPVQFDALCFIHRKSSRGVSIMQRDIEKYIGLRPSSVSTLLSNLEKDGFIVRTVSEGDARVKYLVLTDKGENLCLKNKMFMDRCDGAIRQAITDEEQKELEKLLTKIINCVSETEKEGV